MDLLKPLKLEKWETQGIKIHWNDGHISQYRSGWLRARCPCASCQEEANKPVAQPTGLNLLPVVDPSSEQLALRGVSARSKTPTSLSVPVGETGVETRVTVIPKRAARTSQATLLVGWFWPHTTISAPAASGSPLLMMLFASLVVQTSATSSALTPI